MGSVRVHEPARAACPKNDVQNEVGIVSVLSLPSMVAIQKGSGAWGT